MFAEADGIGGLPSRVAALETALAALNGTVGQNLQQLLSAISQASALRQAGDVAGADALQAEIAARIASFAAVDDRIGAEIMRATDLDEQHDERLALLEGGDFGGLNLAERLAVLELMLSPQRGGKMLMAGRTGGIIGFAFDVLYRMLQWGDLPKGRLGALDRNLGDALDDGPRSLRWHRSKTRPNDGCVALESALDFRRAAGSGRRWVSFDDWGWQWDAYPDPARLGGALIDCNGIAPGAPPTVIAADPTRPILYLNAASSGLRMRGAFHARYRSRPASSLVRAIHIRDGVHDVIIDDIILDDATAALYVADCERIRIRRVTALGADAKIIATATAQDVRIGEWIGPGSVSVAGGGDVKIGNVYDAAALSAINSWPAKQIFSGGAEAAYVPYGVNGYSSLLVPTRQEVYEKIEAVEADRLTRDAINLTGNLPSSVTLARASTARYWNASGVLTTAAINEARIAYRYNGSAWVPAGLQVEAAATNYITYSSDFTQSYWVKSGLNAPTPNSGPALDGTTGMTLLTASGTPVLRQSAAMTVVDGNTYTFSGFFKAGPTPAAWILLTLGNAITPTSYVRVWFNPNTGQVGSTGALGAGWSLIGTPEVEPAENGVFRFAFSAQVAGTALVARMEWTSSNGIGSSSMPGVQLYIEDFQVEPGSRMTSSIRTNGSTGARSADAVSIDWKTSRTAPKGPISIRYTFDDGTTQTRAGVALANGVSSIPTDLNRRRIKSALNLTLEG